MPDIQVEVSSLNIEVQVAATGPQGATGPAGEGVPTGGSIGQVLTKLSATDYDTDWLSPGAASNLETYPAGENLNAGRLVIIASGSAYHFQPGTPTHAGRAFGITRSSALTGADVTIQPFGVVTDSAFSALTETTVWAIANGQVSNTPPASGIVQKVGVYLGSNKLLIDFTQQIVLI